MNAQQRLNALRQYLVANRVDYYFVPSSDTHQNEYVPPAWQRRTWLTGFSGSAGDALVGLDQAYLWTDGRYFLQAELELDGKCFQLMRQMQGVAAPIHQWLSDLKKPTRLAVDPKVLTLAQKLRFEEALKAQDGVLIARGENWVDAIWADRPDLPQGKIFSLPEAYAGQSVTQKLGSLRKALSHLGAQAMAINVLDQIAWLYNLRGEDIPYNPVAISYALIEEKKAYLFVDAHRIAPELAQALHQAGIELAPYEEFASRLSALKDPVLLDPHTASWWMESQIEAPVILAPSPIESMKAVKNTVEQQGMREAHRLDGLAVCRFLFWLETHWQQEVTEQTAADRLAEFRQASSDCRGLSFDTISGFADHSAIIHYRVDEKSNRRIDSSSLYLLDSGGQYWQGTTDITRTLHLGNPNLEQKKLYTAVLKGHLALARQRFPLGTSGCNLDALARQYLWQLQLDYGHGTGHGVGCYLCVHEGPQRITRAGPQTQVPLLPGMVVSNEPGFYWPKHWGIRIENLCLIVPCKDSLAWGERGSETFLQFEDLTLVPYAKNLIHREDLSDEEIHQVNAYHQRVWDTLSTAMSTEEKSWLKAATTPLE